MSELLHSLRSPALAIIFFQLRKLLAFRLLINVDLLTYVKKRWRVRQQNLRLAIGRVGEMKEYLCLVCFGEGVVGLESYGLFDSPHSGKLLLDLRDFGARMFVSSAVAGCDGNGSQVRVHVTLKRSGMIRIRVQLVKVKLSMILEIPTVFRFTFSNGKHRRHRDCDP